MDGDTLYIGAIYNPEGKRIGIEISSSGIDHIKDRMANVKKTFGTDFTFKIYECKEVRE